MGFLQELFVEIPHGDYLELAVASQLDAKQRVLRRGSDFFFNNIPEAEQFIENHRENFSIYWGPALRYKFPKNKKDAGNDTYIKHTKVLWTDIDNINHSSDSFPLSIYADFLDVIPSKIRPSVSYTTGGGMQCLWIMEDYVDCLWAKAVMQGIQKEINHLIVKNGFAFRADDVSNPSRIIRFPETRNFKYEPYRQSVIIESEFAFLYNYEALDHFREFVVNTPYANDVCNESAQFPIEIKEGERNTTCYKYAASLLGQNYHPQSVMDRVFAFDAERCKPPLQSTMLGKSELERSISGLVKKHMKNKKTNIQDDEFSVKSVTSWLNNIGEEEFALIITNIERQFKNSPKSTMKERALHFAKQHNIIRLNVPDIIYKYNEQNGTWESQSAKWLHTEIHKYCGAIAKKSTIQEMDFLVRTLPEITIKKEEMDACESPHYVNLLNGTLDTRELKVLDHKKENYFTYCLPINYDKKAKSRLWLKFVSDIFPTVEEDSEQKHMLLQEWFGYHLFYTNYFQKALILIGQARGANGKSVTIYVLQKLLGVNNCVNTSLKDLSNDKFEKVRLYQKKATFLMEAEPIDFQTNRALFNQLISGDMIGARTLFQEGFDFANNSKITIASNHMPKIEDPSSAWHRKILFLNFNQNFDHCKDENLKYKLTTPEELSGIFNWSLIGLKRLKEQRHFTVPETSKITSIELEQESNPLKIWLDHFCEYDDTRKKIYARQVYNAYNKYFEGLSIQNKSKLKIKDVDFLKQLKLFLPPEWGRKVIIDKDKKGVYIAGLKYSQSASFDFLSGDDIL